MSKNKVIDYNGILNTVKQGYSYETDAEYWDKAQDLLPDLNLPKYEDIFVSALDEYPANPKDAIIDNTLINSSLKIIEETFNNQDIETILSYVEGSPDYLPKLKEQIKTDIKAWKSNTLPGAFGYGPYANNPFNQSLYDQDPEYAAMHNLFLTNPLKWEQNAKRGMYNRFGDMNPSIVADENWIQRKEKERKDWHDKINLLNRERESKEIQEFIGEDNLSAITGTSMFGSGQWNSFVNFTPEEKEIHDKVFGDWENEGRYVSIFGGKLPIPRFKKDSDGLYSRNEDLRKKSGIFTIFGDEWLSNNSKVPEFLKTHIKSGINNTVPGINYAIETGEEIYSDIPEYEPKYESGIGRVAETVGGGLLTFIASMSDPSSVGSMFVPYALGGRVALGTTKKGLQYFSKSFDKYTPSKLYSWFNNASGNHVLNNMPRFMQGTQGYKIKEGIKSLITNDRFAKAVYDIGGFSSAGAYHSMLHSRKNQKLNLGKYETNNGTISYWDTINDSWKGWRNGASMALLFNGTSYLFGRSNILQNSYFKKGTLKSKAANFATKTAEIGTGGAILTAVPIALDEDVRRQYYDENGNFDLSRLTADTMINTGILSLFWGIRNVDVKSFRAKEKGLTSYKPEFDFQQKTSSRFYYQPKDAKSRWYNQPFGYKFRPYTGGKFSGNSKRDINNIVVKRTDNNAITVPDNKSFPKFLNEVKIGLSIDNEYENNKLTNKNHYSNDDKNLLKNSLENIQKDLGPESGFEFFDEISKVDTGEIETVRGLKSIEAIVNETISILNKGAIKDKKGNIIGVDAANISHEDANFLLYVTPTAIKSYQGYLMQYNATDEGKAEYIKRFEMEKNNGKKISPAMEKTVLRALEMRLNRFDVITRDFNSMLKYGDTKAEQIQVNPENKAPLTQEYMDVVLVENGKPITGDVLSIEKDTALAGIKQGKFIKKSDAESQALSIGEVESPNQGIATLEDQKALLSQAIYEGIALTKPYSSQILIPKGDYPKFIEPYREGEIGHKSLERKVDSKITTSNIKDPFDIAVLGGKDSPIGAKELKKRIPALNSLMESSGKKSLSEITTDDIKKWGNDRIAEIKKENAGKHINEQKPAVMQNNPISNVRAIFEALQQKGFIKLNPVTTEVQKFFSSHSTKTKAALRAKQTGLPELKVWYKKLPKVYETMVKKNKDYKIALALGDHLSIRSLEIQALKGEHILKDSKTGIPYLDLMTPTTEGGAAKGTGILRPVAISEGLYKELIKIADKKQPGSYLFPGYQKLLTKELQKTFPVGPDNIKLRASDFKNQQIALAKRYANLSVEENRIFNTISGHSEGASAIVQEYLAKVSMGDLLKLQVQVMKKVNAARIELENTMKSMPLEKAIGKVMKFVKEDLSIGLSIKDVSGKKANEIVKTVNKEVKQGEILSSDVKKKFTSSVEKVFNDLVPKNLDVSERSAMMAFYAKNAGIEDYSNFNFKSATTEELVLFSDKIVREPKVFTAKTRDLARRLENIGLARRIFEANNYNNEKQRRYIQLAFFPEKELSEVSYLQLDHKQSVELVNLIKGDELLNTVYDAENNIIKDKFDYVHLAINTDNIANLSKQMPLSTKIGLWGGALGTAHATFPWLAKKLNAPHLVKIGEDVSNRRLAESRIGGYVQDFETTIYKTIYNFAKEKGDFNRLRLLMPSVIRGGTIGIGKLKTYVPLVSLPDVQTVVRSLAGDEQYKYKYGMKIFDNHIKHNLWSLDPKRYNDLKEHVLAHPEDKVGVKRFETAKPFHEGVYVTENNYKELGLTKKAIGSLRTDTMESYIAREWYKYTDKLWDHTLLVLRKSMTEARWETFIKKYPLVEIKKHFYVPIIHTEVFGDHYGFGQINLDKKILRRGISHAKKHAKEKYGDKPTQKQIDEFLEIGELEAYSDVAVMQSSYQGNKQNPKHILRRRFYTGERVFIEKQNKWVDAIEHDYDMSIRPHAATMAKTIANIEYFPFLVGIPGLKFNHNYPKVLAELSNRGGAVGSYINDMILAETGLTPPSNKIIATTNDVITAMNKYASRIILMGVRSPLKNLIIGSHQNLLGWDTHKALYQHARSLSYRNRIEARKTGYMGLSLSKLTENEDKLLSVILDKMWHTFKFRSTEESTRLSSMFLAMDEVPALCDALNSKNAKIAAEAYDRATSLYEVLETPIQISKDIVIKGGELEILKKLGTDIDFKYDITKKDFGVNRLITVNRDLKPMERKILKDEIEKVHFKIISRAHEKAQGSTAPLDLPLIIQTPILSGGALFSKMAIRATEWTFRGVNRARKYNDWKKLFAWLAGGYAGGQILSIAFDELLKGLPNPRELDRKDWKKIFRTLKTAEMGGIASIFWGIAEGKMPMGNPIFGFAQLKVVNEVGKYLLEKLAQTTEAVGIKPEGKGDFANFFIAKKTGWQAEKDLLSAVNGAYREWRAIKENKMHPYREAQKQFDENEKHFYSKVMPLSSKPQIVKNHINSAEYREIKDAFELTEFEKDGDFTRINEVVFSTFQSLYWQKIEANYPPDEAMKLTQQSIEAKLLALDPILNGLGQSGKHKSWFSIRDGYMTYLKETAIAQGKDKHYYWKPLAIQKNTYDKKIKSFYKQFPGWIRKNKSKEMEAFMLKAMTNIHPTTWDLLGLPDINKERLKRFNKDLNK